MKFTDIFVKRPVLASVVSLLILVLGLRAAFSLPVQQYPQTESAQVTVSTFYYGADPDVVAGFITTPLEQAIAQANGIDYMTSTSASGLSTITINLRLNYDANRALTEITSKVSSVLNSLPPGSQQPVIAVQPANIVDAMYIGFSSGVLPANKITDYLVRVVQPKFQAIEGVQTAELIGAKNFALRAWLDPDKLTAYGVTAADVSTALSHNDYISGLGTTKGEMVQMTLTASTGMHTVQEFENLVIKQSGDAIVRLADVAKVTLGAEDYDNNFVFDGNDSIAVGIKVAPNANLLQVIKRVRAAFPDIASQLPQGLKGEIVYDSTEFITASISEVIRTLVEALVIVTIVVFAFMGSPRAVFIPVVAMPLSMVGTFAMMLVFGFSINLLTLLAIVLAIGLVVDDAIIVVENVTRHLEDGEKPFDAALQAARELGGPIVAMTIVLVAVYVPIGFQGGLTGALFVEFAFTLVGAVTISAIIALTLSPMLSSRLLRRQDDARGWEKSLVQFIDRRFGEVHGFYVRLLKESLRTVTVTLVFAVLILVSIVFLYRSAQSELAPTEDQSFLLTSSSLASDSTAAQASLYGKQFREIVAKHPELQHVFQVISPNNIFGGLVLKPWQERSTSATKLVQTLSGELSQVAGAQVGVFPPPSLPGGFGFPIQIAIGTTQPFQQLQPVADAFLGEAMKSGAFMFLISDLRIDFPEATVEIDRNKLAQLGLSVSDVGNALSSLLGGGYVNYFSLAGRSYRVIPQIQQRSRLNAQQLLEYSIRAPDGSMVQLSTIAKIATRTIPVSLNHFQQLNAATVSGVPMPGVSLGDAVKSLQAIGAHAIPQGQGYYLDYGGETRQYVQESSGFLITFGFALIVIFLALAALFESFRDPVIILVSVPMSIAGALIFISLGVGGATLNIYTEVGLVTLMGVISKHGILLVEFANEAQKRGLNKLEAIEEAASIRFRPILMTTAAMVFGVLPLVVASGAGAAARFSIGLVVSSGIAIGTLFTLFVVPAVYLLIAAEHQEVHEVAEDRLAFDEAAE